MEKKPPEEKKPAEIPKISSKLEAKELPPQTLPPIETPLEEKKPPEEKPETPEEAELKSKELMLKWGFNFAGSAMETLANDPEMNLNDEELDALIEVWKPFIPEMPPWACAAIVTGVIFGKRGIMYYEKRHKAKEEKKKEAEKGKLEEKPTVTGGKPEERPEEKPEPQSGRKLDLSGL